MILLHHDYLQVVHFLELNTGHTSNLNHHCVQLPCIPCGLTRSHIYGAATGYLNHTLKPVDFLIQFYALYTHIHDDNNEDYGCADAIYNLYHLIITHNIHRSIPTHNKKQLLTFIINYIMSLDLFTHSTANTLKNTPQLHVYESVKQGDSF